MTLSTTLTMGAVALSVSDLTRSCAFYEEALGLPLRQRSGGSAAFGNGDRDLLELIEKPGARLDPTAPGLFHFALRVATRQDLADTLARLLSSKVKLDGAADHIVSEALYLSDPDGHGIEIYRDRPRSGWRYADDGSIDMATLPLDIADLLAQARPEHTGVTLGSTIEMGHVHLQVNDVESAGAALAKRLPLKRMASMHSALFLGADGYHHHFGVNSWRTRGAGVRDRDRLGLEHLQILMPRGVSECFTVEGIPLIVRV